MSAVVALVLVVIVVLRIYVGILSIIYLWLSVSLNPAKGFSLVQYEWPLFILFGSIRQSVCQIKSNQINFITIFYNL